MTRNKAASIRDRLKNIARSENTDFQRILNNYAIQKLLVRIAKSPYRENLLLKGSWLFVAWSGNLHRPTKDADMLSLGSFDKPQIKKMFQEIVQIEVDDSLQFLAESITVTDITKDGLYQGFRMFGFCLLDKARIKIQIDLGVGDSVTPCSTTETIACVLGEDEAILSAYPIYTAISEKWHAICKLGITNSRLKDYYDLYVIASLQDLSGESFIEAVRNTFARRETEINDELPLGISAEFYEDNAKKKAWEAFLTKNDLECEKSLPEICEFLEHFLHPVNKIIANDSDDNLHEWSSSRLIWSI